MNKCYLLSLVVLCLFITCTVNAQRFNAGLILGMNLSQLDGDKQQGYNKLGLQIGARGSAVINKRLELSTGLIYTQKGSTFEKKILKEVIRLNYMEVPILINYRTSYSEEKRFYRWQWFTGVSVGRLISSSVEEDKRDDFDFMATTDFLNSTDITHIIGFNYYLNPHLAMGIQSSVSLNKVYDATENPIEGNSVERLRNYLLSLHLVYMLW